MGDRWVVVMMPRGDVVRLDSLHDDWPLERLFCSMLDGTLDLPPAGLGTARRERVGLRGTFISLAWRENRP